MNAGYSPIHWFLITIFGIGALVCLLKGARYYRSAKLPENARDMIRCSLVNSGWLTGIFSFVIAIIFVMDWAKTGNILAMQGILPIVICLGPLFFLLVFIIMFLLYSQEYMHKKYPDN